MSAAQCAHLHVSWRTKQVVYDGPDLPASDPDSPNVPLRHGAMLTTGWWECDFGCGAQFRPASAAVTPETMGEVSEMSDWLCVCGHRMGDHARGCRKCTCMDFSVSNPGASNSGDANHSEIPNSSGVSAGVSDKTRELVEGVSEKSRELVREYGSRVRFHAFASSDSALKFSEEKAAADESALLSHIESIEDSRDEWQRTADAFAADVVTYQAEIASLRTQLSTALRDSERLDWLEAEHERTDPVAALMVKQFYNRNGNQWANCGRSARTEIDAAMKGSTE